MLPRHPVREEQERRARPLRGNDLLDIADDVRALRSRRAVALRLDQDARVGLRWDRDIALRPDVFLHRVRPNETSYRGTRVVVESR